MLVTAILIAILALGISVFALRHLDFQQDEIEILTRRLRLLEEHEWGKQDAYDFLAEQAFREDMRKRIDREKASRN